MKIIFVTIITFLFASTMVMAENKVGSISGKINYCNNDVASGIQVFVPGKPHVVITGSDGKFLLSNVPAGEYELNFMLYGKVLQFSQLASVRTGQDTTFEKLEFCNDGLQVKFTKNNLSDESGFNIPEEQVILKTPDCANVKEGVSFLLNNGKGRCQNGEVVIYSCNTHYSDCDENPSNGCEVDTNTDMNHCGGCFNECAELESCDIGIC